MNQRQRQLLLYLLSIHHYQTIQEVCTTFMYSEKTIRNDIKTINAYLKKNHTPACIETKRGSGVRLLVDEQEIKHIQYILDSGALELAPDLERFYRGITQLLFTSTHYTMDALAETLYTNRVQLKEDLSCWESMLKTFHCTISKLHYLHIEGDERQIRLFVLYYFYQKGDKAMRAIIEPLFLQDYAPLCKHILQIYEQKFQQRYTENALHHYYILLGIMMKRIQHGHTLQGSLHYEGEIKVRTLLQDTFHVAIPDEEMLFFEQALDCGARQWNQDMLHRFSISARTNALCDRFFSQLSSLYDAPYDQELTSLFAILLQTAITRKQDAMRVLHYYDTTVKYNTMAEFLSVMYVFHKDVALNKLQLYESEYTRLTMLLLPYFHQIDIGKHVRVGLIVNCSLELAYYGRKRIMEAIPQIEIVTILTEDEIETICPTVDFFIAFEYLQSDVVYVEISSIIQDQDLYKLRTFLNDRFHKQALQNPIPYTNHKSMVQHEEALLHSLYLALKSHDVAIDYKEFMNMYLLQHVMLQDRMLYVILDDRIPSSFLISLTLQTPFYVNGEKIKQAWLACFAPKGYAQLKKELLQMKTHVEASNP